MPSYWIRQAQHTQAISPDTVKKREKKAEDKERKERKEKQNKTRQNVLDHPNYTAYTAPPGSVRKITHVRNLFALKGLGHEVGVGELSYSTAYVKIPICHVNHAP